MQFIDHAALNILEADTKKYSIAHGLVKFNRMLHWSGINYPYPSMVSIIKIDKFPPPPLLAGTTHVYITTISALEENQTELSSSLNELEKQRAERFINPEHGRRFTLVRGLLRQSLGFYLHQAPSTVLFHYNRYGQPSVKPDNNQTSFHFNISHSHEMAAFAFSHSRVGIDIEYKKEMKNLNALINYISHPDEISEFKQLPAAETAEAFFRLWTRKEAFIKANGQGLSMGLRSIYIGIDDQSITTTVQYKSTSLHNWYIEDLPCNNAYKSAIAIETATT